MPTAKKKAKKSKAKPKRKASAKAAKKPVKKSIKRAKKPVKKNASKKVKKPAIKSAPAKKKVSAPAAEPAWHQPRQNEVLAGVVEDYLSHLEVILTTLKAPLSVGEMVSIRGFTTNTEQIVRSIQIEHAPVSQAAAGQAVGIKVDEKVRKNDHIFKQK